MKNNMVHLHNHCDRGSNLRLIDCISTVKGLIDRAVELGNPGIAITDHESVSAHVKAIQYVKDGKAKGKIPKDFKLILGNEIYLVDEICFDPKDEKKSCPGGYYHFILLAKDEIGHRQIRELSSLAWDNSFRTGKMERVPTLKSDLKHIVKSNPGHLIASSACLGGEVAKTILRNDHDGFNRFVEFCINLFGEDFYFELQPSSTEDQIKVNTKLMEILDINDKYIITCDSHYIRKKDRIIHEAYLKSHEEEREVDDFYATTYMMTTEEIHEYLDSQMTEERVNVALENTLKICSSINEYDLYHPTIVPEADIPSFTLQHTFSKYYKRFEYLEKYAYSENEYDRYLLKLIEEGYVKKIPQDNLSQGEELVMVDRIATELKEMWLVTEKLKNSISSYYISTLELINIMWEDGDSLVGIARGSVTGMFTMYLIGITQINPILWGLPHWRHISHEKIELSDVDIDSQANRRNQIIQAVKKRKGERKVLNCCTFKTEGSKSAVLTACRGLGIDIDESQYIANMIPVTRGFTWSLHDCIYGNPDEERKPITEFINECAKHPNLLKTAMGIEGLVCGRSMHASAVYIFNEDFLEHNARMKTPSGDYVTQFNMKDSDYCSGLKMDFLTIEALDKIRLCMDMLIEAGHMKWQGSLRATYDKYLHPDVLDYDTEEMWDLIGKNAIPDLFQFDTQVGLQAAQRIKPKSLTDLATANSIMRLMVSGEDAEQPIDTYIRYKNNINEWYGCMRNEYKLTEDEIKILEKYLLPYYGVGATQEDVMLLSMDEHIAGFNVTQSNKLRKGIAKKDKDLQAAMKKMFFEHGKEIGTSENMLSYIWNEVVGKQLGYSFSLNHTLPYSAIGLQEMNLYYHYPSIYWNTACLSINAGADENVEDNKSTKYGKVAAAISNMQKRGVTVSLPLINEASFSFKPDEKNNQIIFGIKGLNGIGDDVARLLINERPYQSMNDFYERMVDTGIIKKSQMIKLIKAGCFTELDCEDRRKTMNEYLSRYEYTPCEKLSMQQFNKMKEMGLLSSEFEPIVRLISFKLYILSEQFLYRVYIDKNNKRGVPQCGYHDRYFKLDTEAIPFYEKHFSEKAIVDVVNDTYIISEKKFLKEYQDKIVPLKDWLSKKETLRKYNQKCLEEVVSKYAEGTISQWEMDSLCFYHGDHELKNLNEQIYGIVNFFDLPEQPEPYDCYVRYIKGERKEFPKYKIVRLAGTVLDSDNNKHIITLLTNYGVVNVKFNKGQYLNYSKNISARLDPNSDKKTVLENSWFKRGNKIMVCGYRQDNQFRAYRYTDTIYIHTCTKIEKLLEDGKVLVKTERVSA